MQPYEATYDLVLSGPSLKALDDLNSLFRGGLTMVKSQDATVPVRAANVPAEIIRGERKTRKISENQRQQILSAFRAEQKSANLCVLALICGGVTWAIVRVRTG